MKTKQRQETDEERRIKEIRAELHQIYKAANNGTPDWREVDRLHHELTRLMEGGDDVADR